jgi:hypothetical protein
MLSRSDRRGPKSDVRNWSLIGKTLGGLLGAVAGIALGATVGPLGVLLGLLLGLGAGYVATKVTQREELLRADRTRHLDAVIGITEGSMGAAPVSVAPPELEEDMEPKMIDADAWLAEWLTPPPPVVG